MDNINHKTIRVIRRFGTFDLVEQDWSYEEPVYDTHEQNLQPDRMKSHTLRMQVYVTKAGHYITCKHKRKRRPGLIKFIAQMNIKPELIDEKHTVCSIGRASDGIWYGWSHRAIVGFKIGDKIFEEHHESPVGNIDPDSVPFRKHGRITIETDTQAKEAAINFADYIS